jgi:hypothetical protein
VGQSQENRLYRKQSNESVYVHDKRFDHFYGIQMEDLRSLFRTYALACKEWRETEGLVSPERVIEEALK